MKKGRFTWLILSFLMALSLVLASCTTTAEEEEEEEEEITPGENWWDKFGEPEYGGTITLTINSLDPVFDNYTFYGAGLQFWFERLWTADWTLDRDIWSFRISFIPAEYYVGLLAESWEIPDASTIIIHIREGVHWQDKPPVNGREFTAYDVEYHYDRMLGTGHGFTEPSPFYIQYIASWERVTATDKYTAVFKFKQPSAASFYQALDPFALNTFEAPESVEQGLLENWEDSVGTGAWMPTDLVVGSSMTFSGNPNYWGWDERHPENKVPYADNLKITCIPDTATQIAALRTRKIDILERIDWEQAGSLERSNPELLQVESPSMGFSVLCRVDKEPFTDINVRKALQRAVDRELIAETHYGGTVDGKPCGLISPSYKGYCFPYEEWPQSLKDEYSYNPERARELLAEAGYPDGFKTNIIACSGFDMELLQIIKSQFMDIGVDMEVIFMDRTAGRKLLQAGEHDQLCIDDCAYTFPLSNSLYVRHSVNINNFTHNNDAGYDAILAKYEAAVNASELGPIATEADRYVIEKHWSVNVCPTVSFVIYQPYLKGYSGEGIGWWGAQHLWARLWIDQDLKESMGR